MKNPWTTILGFLAGATTYLSTSGATMPASKQDWINLALGALLAGLGIASRDASSKPAEAKTADAK